MGLLGSIHRHNPRDLKREMHENRRLSANLNGTRHHGIQSLATRLSRLIRHGLHRNPISIVTALMLARRDLRTLHQTEPAMIRKNEPAENRRHDDDDAKWTVGADGVQWDPACSRVPGDEMQVARFSNRRQPPPIYPADAGVPRAASAPAQLKSATFALYSSANPRSHPPPGRGQKLPSTNTPCPKTIPARADPRASSGSPESRRCFGADSRAGAGLPVIEEPNAEQPSRKHRRCARRPNNRYLSALNSSMTGFFSVNSGRRMATMMS